MTADTSHSEPKPYTVRVDFDLEALDANDAITRVQAALQEVPAPLDRPLLPFDVFTADGEQVAGPDGVWENGSDE